MINISIDICLEHEIFRIYHKYECKDVNPELNKHMKDMFKNMKKSLKEELGSVNNFFYNTYAVLLELEVNYPEFPDSLKLSVHVNIFSLN